MTSPAENAPISAAEEAARRSRRGYEYQDLVAASFCIEMLRDKTLCRVACETQDDVVLTWTNSGGNQVDEFVQVKSDRLTQQWTIAVFCKQDAETFAGGAEPLKGAARYRKDSSIFEKNASRDQGRQTARFRIVTRADVKEMRVLAESHDRRGAPAVAALAKELGEALDGHTSLKAQEIEYWAAQAAWDVRGSESALFAETFHHLAKAVELQEGRLLAVVELERLLQLLATETRAMATGKGRCGADPNAVTQDEMRSWLSVEVRTVPHFLGSAETDALLREERRSLARCETLWLALDVPREDAAGLARQPEVGARTEFFTSLDAGFHWITATYGMGKSLAAERLFQLRLADYAALRDERVPIFFRATEIAGSLQDAVLAHLRILQHEGGSPKLFVILDAVDEAGMDRGHNLLREALEICAAWPGSTFIATSTNLPFSLEQFRHQMPSLPDEQASEIVSRFAHYEVPPWMVRERLDADCGLALMCVLLGMALHETAQATPSKGELLHRVVEAARKRSGTDAKGWATEADLLCRIAMLSTDEGGGPVRPADLGMTSLELVPLYATRLVVEEAGNLVFTVSTIRLWFAAQAFLKGWIDETDLVADLQRARRWQEPLAIFLATADFDSAARYFEPLAAAHPAVSAQVIIDATSQWGHGGERTLSEFAAFAGRVRRCLEAWLTGIAPLARGCNFTDRNGQLLKVRAGFAAPHTVIVFSDDASLPPASALPNDWKFDMGERFFGYKESDEPSHLWRQSYAMVSGDLRKLVEHQRWELTDPALFHEVVWNQAVGLARGSRWFSASLAWEAIQRHEQVFRRLGMWKWLCEMRSEHPMAFPAPHPPADIDNEGISWIHAFYSQEAALRRAQSVYATAFAAYQRIVHEFFPRFKNDLKHSAWWPCRLVGEVRGVDEDGTLQGWWLSYHCEPVSSDAEALVTLTLGKRGNSWFCSEAEKLRMRNIQLRPDAPDRFWMQSTALHFENSHPATELVRKWLLDDLNEAGW